MHAETPSIALVAQQADTDLKRDAGLRGEEFSNAVIGLSVVFGLGLLGLIFVVFMGRRRSPPKD